ncbi:MAG: efflux RND transporter permease subunit [Desulfamplus sp.]
MKITVNAVRKRIATSVITIALVVLGVYGLLHLPVNFLPDMTYPMVKVHIWWRGATPDEINTNIADPIERQMATVDGLDYLESSAIEGMYTLVVNFRYDVDIDVAYQDAMAAMARVARQLPKDIDPPLVFKADPSQLPVVQLTVRSDKWDLVKLRTWADNWLQDQLLSVSGVAGTEVVGGLKREIRVHLDPLSMEKYGLSLTAVIKSLQAENLEQSSGRVTAETREIIVRTMGEYRSLDEIRSIVLTRNGGAKITLNDVAEVKDAHEEVRVITRLNSSPSIKLSVLKQADANTVEVAQSVSHRIKELSASLTEGIELGMVENQADYIIPALKGVRNAAVEAAILVFIVVYLFLGSWRQVVVMLLALPVTLILNFGFMKLAGFSLNIFSLGGLVVAIGVVLDNSIVVIENITRLQHDNISSHTESVNLKTLSASSSSTDISIEGTSQVGSAILAATLSFIALFVPFLMVPGLTSLLFKELILVIAGIVSLSLGVAITLTPMLMSVLSQKKKSSSLQNNSDGKLEEISRFEKFFELVASGYGKILSTTLNARWFVIIAFIAVLTGGILLARNLGSEFLPQMDDGRVMVKVKLPTGAALGETDKILGRIENQLSSDSIIQSAFTLAGGKIWGLYTYEIANEGQIDIQLVPRHKRNITTKEYIERLRPVIAKISVPGGKIMVMQAQIKGLRKLGEADIEVKIKGEQMEKLFSLAKQTAENMRNLKQFTNIYLSMDMTKPEYQIQIDRTKAAELGISVEGIATTARSLLSGAVATKYRDGDDFYNIRVMIPETKIKTKQDIENLIINNTNGGTLRLSDVAKVNLESGPVEIVREDQVKTVIVRGDATGASVGEALKSLQLSMEKLTLPKGYEISFGGQAQMMAQMKNSIILILGFAMFFAFVVLAVQFNSLKLPFLILATVPFCASGMVYALYLTSIPLGATVLIGMLIVVASTVNEGVLLLTVVEELRINNKMSVFDALIHGATIRLRPRVMIASAIIAGFIPLAMNLEEGGDMLQPMAVSAIGGLSIGLFVALFLLPCLYFAFTRR